MLKKREQLLTEKIVPLMVRLSTPAIVGMLMVGLYQLIDAIFVGQWVGTAGLAAVSLIQPITFASFGIAMLVGIGSASLLSRAMGANDHKTLSRIFGNLTLMSISLSLVITVLCVVFARSIARFMGAEGLVLDYSETYLRIVILGSVLINFAASSNMLVRAEGRMKEAMAIMGSGVLLNIALDPIFIKVLGLGVSGAAIATVISQALMVVGNVVYFRWGKTAILVTKKSFRFAFDLMPGILSVGFSALALQVMNLIQQMFIYRSIAGCGNTDDIAVMGAILRVMSFAYIPLWGMAQGLQPIVGMNYGAKQYDRVKLAVRTFCLGSTVVALVFWLGFQLFPKGLLSWFITDPAVVAAGVPAVRMVLSSFVLYGVIIMIITHFQAIGKGSIASTLTVARILGFFLPLVLTLPRFLALRGVWLSIPLADGLTALVALGVLVWEFRRLDGLHRAGLALQTGT